FTLIEDDVEPFGIEVALLLREVVPGVDALQLEIEREFDRCRPLAGGRIGARGAQPQNCEQRGRPAKARHRFVLRWVQQQHALASKLHAKRCLVGLALSGKAAIASAMVTMITAIPQSVACYGSHCLVFDQRPLGAAHNVGLSLIEEFKRCASSTALMC